MEKDYSYMNAGIPIQGLLEPSSMQPWNSFSLPQELNSSCFFNPNWDKPNDNFTQFQSTLTSVVSSSSVPTCSSSGIRELIAKSGPILNSSENPLPILNKFGKENLPNFATDPEIAKRAAMFSCFGSHSFTARRSYSVLSDAESTHRSMARVWSSPSLKQADGSSIENKNSLKTQMKINNLNRFPSIDPNSNESSSISEQVLSGETMSKVANEIHTTRKRKPVPKSKAKENVSSTVDCHKDGEADDAKNGKRARTKESSPSTKGGINRHWKEEEENDDENVTDAYSAALDEQHKPEKVTEKSTEPPKDYIHVRARRGQATDSHSLAERVRREKIGERMKFLQDLVPGCNKVTGKALMLDEIINYVQSLQCQVEFLSMKLASVDPRKEVDMDNFASKDIMRRNGSLSNSLYPVDSSGLYSHHQANQYPAVHGNASLSTSPMEPVHKTSSNNLELQLPSLNEFVDCLPQFPAFFEEDLQSIVGMGFSQAAATFHSMSFPLENQLQRSP